MSSIKDVVKERYGQAALRVVSGNGAACCGSSPSSSGFVNIGVEPTRIYRSDDAISILGDEAIDIDTVGPLVDGKFMSAFVRAQKPPR